MTVQYDPAHISSFYDQYGEREWDRFDDATTPINKVNYHIHRTYLERYIAPGDRVLEVGAGAGRFTIDLARRGATVTVGDISPGQLALNGEKVRAAGCEGSVAAREMLDVVDLSRYPTDHFDATVCYGGPISYVFDRADEAVGELVRVTKPRGHILLSVMSLVGSTAHGLPVIVELVRSRVWMPFSGSSRQGICMATWRRASTIVVCIGGQPCAISSRVSRVLLSPPQPAITYRSPTVRRSRRSLAMSRCGTPFCAGRKNCAVSRARWTEACTSSPSRAKTTV